MAQRERAVDAQAFGGQNHEEIAHLEVKKNRRPNHSWRQQVGIGLIRIIPRQCRKSTAGYSISGCLASANQPAFPGSRLDQAAEASPTTIGYLFGFGENLFKGSTTN